MSANPKADAWFTLAAALREMSDRGEALSAARKMVEKKSAAVDFLQDSTDTAAAVAAYKARLGEAKRASASVLRAYDRAAKASEDKQEREHVQAEMRMVAIGALQNFDDLARVWRGIAVDAGGAPTREPRRSEEPAPAKAPAAAPAKPTRPKRTAAPFEREFAAILATLKKAGRLAGTQGRGMFRGYAKNPQQLVKALRTDIATDVDWEGRGAVLNRLSALLSKLEGGAR